MDANAPQAEVVQQAEGQPLAVVLGKRALKNPKVQVTIGLWAVGMILVLFGTSPVTLTRETENAYFDTLKSAHDISTYELEEEVYKLEQYVYDAKSWFWRFNEEARTEVERRQAIADEARDRLNKVYAEKRKLEAKAKGYVGVWSQYSIDEAKFLFWDAFERAKEFVKRMTFYDVLFSMFRGRDDSLVAFAFRWIFQILMNITFGLIGCVIAFMWAVFWMIWEYSPSLLSGLGFFAVAMLGCLSVILTVVFLVYGTAIGVGYVVVKNAAQSIEAGPQGQRHFRQIPQGGYYRQQRFGQPYGDPNQRQHYE